MPIPLRYEVTARGWFARMDEPDAAVCLHAKVEDMTLQIVLPMVKSRGGDYAQVCEDLELGRTLEHVDSGTHHARVHVDIPLGGAKVPVTGEGHDDLGADAAVRELGDEPATTAV